MVVAHKYFVSDLVKEVGSLPSVAAAVVNLTSRADCELSQLSKIIRTDGVMTMRFLALANSAAMSRGHEIRELKDALVRLGCRKIRNVALLMGMHDMQQETDEACPLKTSEYWKYCLATAICAENLSELRGAPPKDDAWLVSILHGIGVPVLIQRTPAEFNIALARARDGGLSLAEAEMEVLEFHHGELGGRVLTAWNLPRVFAEAVEFHAEDFESGEIDEEAQALVTVLRDAIALVRTIGYGDSGDGNESLTLPDLMERLGLDDDGLRQLSELVDREVGVMARCLGIDLPGDKFSAALAFASLQLADVGFEGFEDSLTCADLENEMSGAREIQQKLLPDAPPVIPGFKLAAINEPSRQVSGDIYDFFTFGDGSFGLMIADVSGKGTPAALLASNLQATIRTLTRVTTDPGQLLKVVNETMFEHTDAHSFVTVFLAILDPACGRLRYANAGHNPPLLRRADGTREWLCPGGTPVGMMPDMDYPICEVDLAAGDLVVAYTDGVTEVSDGAGEMFDEAGLERIVHQVADTSPNAVITSVLNAVRAHLLSHRDGGGEGSPFGAVLGSLTEIDAGDDLTLVVLRRDP
jgi:HD-like signal output (HDOD) protein